MREDKKGGIDWACKQFAKREVALLLDNLRGRQGLLEDWSMIDKETQSEIYRSLVERLTNDLVNWLSDEKPAIPDPGKP